MSPGLYKALWPDNVCICDSWHAICSLLLCAQSQLIYGFIKLSKAISFWIHVDLQGNFLQTAVSQSKMTTCRMSSPLVGLSPVRYQTQCPDIQTYGLSAEISPKSAVNIGNGWCWAQLRGGSHKCLTIGLKVSFSKPFFSPQAYPHISWSMWIASLQTQCRAFLLAVLPEQGLHGGTKQSKTS